MEKYKIIITSSLVLAVENHLAKKSKIGRFYTLYTLHVKLNF